MTAHLEVLACRGMHVGAKQGDYDDDETPPCDATLDSLIVWQTLSVQLQAARSSIPLPPSKIYSGPNPRSAAYGGWASEGQIEHAAIITYVFRS